MMAFELVIILMAMGGVIGFCMAGLISEDRSEHEQELVAELMALRAAQRLGMAAWQTRQDLYDAAAATRRDDDQGA